MNVYGKIDISFWCNSKEYRLFPTFVDEYEDSIEIVSGFIDENLHRGCIGELFITTFKGIAMPDNGDAPDHICKYDNILLRNILIYSTNLDEPILFKYVFLKD